MKTKLLLIAILFFAGLSNAQVIRCFTDENAALLRAEHPEMESIDEFEHWLDSTITERNNNPNARIVGGVYQIPVVVHVIHNGEAVGTGSNISYAAIQSQIDVLNEDFRKIMYSAGYNTNPVGADTEIEFVLAKRRPNGTAFPTEDGVNRINRSTAGFTAPPYATSYIDATIKTYTYNGGTPTATRGWTPDKYLNIWLCNISGGVLGYAQFPQSPLGGMGCGVATTATDGVVFLYSSIGKSSVTGFSGKYNEGRTATHEVGHWLGLRHIWGDASGCTGNDYCNDTPVAAAANFDCPTGTNSCPANPGDDMIENYMDYTDDICMNIFTYDQKTRMRTVLESTPLRQSLINSDACVAPNANDVSVIDITNPIGDNCAGAITPVVKIKNRGTSTLTSATISYQVDNGTITTFSYSGSLASGATATVSLPAFTSFLGNHTFKAYSTLPNGAADPEPLYDTVQISFMVSKGLNAPYTQDFESDVFPPDLKWVVDNANVDCYEWLGGSATSITGTLDNNAALFPGFGNSSASTDNLITPIFILPCNATAANIQFDVAYRRRNSTPANYERLYVEISEDCGTTWNSTPIYDKTGTALQVLTSTLTSYYIPAGTTDWRTETVNLASFITGSSKNIKFRFRAVAANGNNIYMDNFKYNATFPAEATVKESSVEVLDGGGLDFGLVNVGSSVTKTFTVSNDGSSDLTLTLPVSVTGTNFTLANNQLTATIAAGTSKTFDVVFAPTAASAYSETLSLTTNDCDEGVYDFLLIGTGNMSAPAANFYADVTLTCTGSTVQFTSTSTNAASYSWNFGTNAIPQTSTDQNPTVQFTTNGAHDVSLVATSIYGSDTETKTSYVTTLNSVSASLPFNEGFTSATFPPTNWSIVNPNSSTTWTRSATVGFAPSAGNSLMFNNFSVNDNTDDQMRMPGMDFTNYASTQLTFDVAYAPRSTTAFDGLEVLVSTDCGHSFTSVYVKANTVLATRTATTSAFVPTAAQWRTETISLSSYVGNNNVIIAFKNLSGNGNNIYIDNINVTGVLNPPTPQFSASATTICVGDQVTFTNATTGVTGTYAWTINGGTPSTSTSVNPVATFSTPGVYSIVLAATNSGGTNTMTKTNYITVNAIPTVSSTTPGSACAPGTVGLGAAASVGTINWYDALTGGNLTGSGTSFTTPSISNHTTYYAEAVNGTCISTARTAVMAAIIPATQIRSYDCGRTSMDFTEKIYCDPLTGVTGYRFEVFDGTNTYEIDRTARYFYLTQIPGNDYNKTYTIRVKGEVNGMYGCYGASCNVMTARPRTKIAVSQCGATLPEIETRIFAETRSEATGYRFKVLRNGANAQIIDKADNVFRLTDLPSYNYNTTYTIYVAYEADGLWGLYGAGCDVSTPVVPPVTDLQASQCESTLTAMTDRIYANNIYLATNYRFEVTYGGNTQVIDRTARYFYLTQYSGWAPNRTYSVRVASRVNGTWTSYGPACNVTTSASSMVQDETIHEAGGELLTDFSLDLYPNPTTGDFTVSSTHEGTFRLINELGQLIQTVQITKENNFEARIEGLESGIYFITGTINHEVLTKKVLVM
ncbi:MAG: PKD domain-containing protein [Bacteroidota bacterium]